MTVRRFLFAIFLLAGISTAGFSGDKHLINLIDTSKLQKLIEQHRGEVVLINVWATWCVPCIEEIPDFIKLSNDLKAGNVRVFGISIDEVEDSATKVLPFIARHRIPYEIFIKAPGKDEQFINALNKEWSGGVPATFIYDAEGIQRRMLVGKQRYSSLRAAIDSVLNDHPHRSP